MCALSGTRVQAAPRFALPTLGGKQVWRDRYVHAGWRIQESVLTGRCRLLDARNRQRASGTCEECRARFDDLRDALGIAPSGHYLILMLHGIARSTGTFAKLQRSLRDTGHDATAISYPSTRGTIEAHAAGLAALLERLEGTRRVSFIAHSMGGLVLRRLLADRHPWMERLEIGRIAMIAPPNQGSAVAGFLRNNPLYRTLFGPAGQQLVPGAVTRMPGLDGYDFIVVAGGRGNGRGLLPFLTGDNDGTISVAETVLDGMRDHILVPAFHARISNHPKTVRAVTDFITAPETPPDRAIAGPSRSK